VSQSGVAVSLPSRVVASHALSPLAQHGGAWTPPLGSARSTGAV